jgi:uncharacterized protein (DUF1684 family)
MTAKHEGEKESLAWREKMEASLRAENSWLALEGLFWLDEGENSFGSDLSNTIRLPKEASSRHMGNFELHDEVVTLFVNPDVNLTIDGGKTEKAVLQPDTEGSPSKISNGPLTMVILKRGDRYGVRVWNNLRAERETFSGRIWYPFSKTFQVSAIYEPYETETLILIENILGYTEDVAAVGSVVFNLHDQEAKLDALGTSSGGLFLLFKDLTSGEGSYPSGRFLTTRKPDGAQVLLDFNRSYNPPCAFTDYATCPLPPPQNTLNIRIEAGERYKSYGIGHP